MGSRKKSADIIGKIVANGDGFVIGVIDDYLIDLSNWQICDIQVKIEKATAKDLGLKTPFFGSLLVLIDIAHIRSATDQVIIDIPVGEFQTYVEDRKKEAKKKGKDAPEAAPDEAKEEPAEETPES